MKVALSTIGKFHTFDLARELHARSALAGIFSGYPRFKLSNERLPKELIHTFPWIHAPYMRMPLRGNIGSKLKRSWEHLDRITLDYYVARRMPACDVFVGLSGSALNSGLYAKQHGARYVCDRGSTHILVQDGLLRDEHARWQQPYIGIDPRAIEREQAEYETADAITVPSEFNKRSFIESGIHSDKVSVLPYGVDLTRFKPTAKPAAEKFDVLFVGAMTLQKGVPDLISAFQRVRHPRKSLTFAGSFSPQFIDFLRKIGLWRDDYRVLGHVPQDALKDVMSRAHVMVLPSIQEGLAMVQAQAMACGCPVIATKHTGAEDLFADGLQGYILPIRRPDLLAERMQALADEPKLRDLLGYRALKLVTDIGGWTQYGDAAIGLYRRLANVSATN